MSEQGAQHLAGDPDGASMDKEKQQVDSQADCEMSLHSNLISAMDSDESISEEITEKRDQWEFYYKQDAKGDTQLHTAISKGLIDQAFFLIDVAPHPCFLNIRNDSRLTPLHTAIMQDQPKIARRLVLAKADLLETEEERDTALHWACVEQRLECVKALTDPFTVAEESILKRLLKKGHRLPRFPQDLELRNTIGDTCLHIAVKGGNMDLVRHLVHLGADLNARQQHGGNGILHIAIEYGGREFTMALLREFKFDLNIRNSFGSSAYEFALYYKKTEIAQELVRLGASTSMKLYDPTDDDQFVLKEDEEYDRDDLIKFLVKIGVTPKSA